MLISHFLELHDKDNDKYHIYMINIGAQMKIEGKRTRRKQMITHMDG